MRTEKKLNLLTIYIFCFSKKKDGFNKKETFDVKVSFLGLFDLTKSPLILTFYYSNANPCWAISLRGIYVYFSMS